MQNTQVIESSLERIAEALESRNRLVSSLQQRITPSARVFGQPADPTDEKPELALVQGQEDIFRLAAEKAWDAFNSRTLSNEEVPDHTVFVEEVTDAIKSCVDFRQDSEKKLAQAMGELSNLRRATHGYRLDALKAARALALVHFVNGGTKNPPDTRIKNFLGALDKLIEMNLARREEV